MPHFVECDHHLLSLDRGLGQVTGFVSNPVQNRYVADAENARDRAKTHVAHGVKQQRQRLHLRRFAARRRHCEIAAARAAVITLKTSCDAVQSVVARAAAFAANIAHGGLHFLVPPMVYNEYG
jgi:hypothetical protein